jgi:dUTP pyrophosphatase
MKVKVKKITPTAIIPERGSKYSAGYDLSADIDKSILIRPQETVKIPTGLSFEVPEGYFGGIYARSGLATKQGLRPANAVGVCDSDYRGEYIVALHNDSDTTRIVEPGQRVAQIIFQPYLVCDLEDADELTQTQRGDGGFGSTGK